MIDTDDPSCGILIGVDVIIRGDEMVGDVIVDVLARIGAIVIFFKPTFLSIVAAFPL